MTVPDSAVLPSVAYLLDVLDRLDAGTRCDVEVQLGSTTHLAELSPET